MSDIDPVVSLANASFGIPYVYPYQRLVVANILDAVEATEDAGTDTGIAAQVVILPTGAGKSLCFQLPAALCPGPTLVVYPLLGLQADQERRLAATSLKAVVLKGGMSREERNTVYEAIKSGSARIIIANPEIIAVPEVTRFLASASVCHFVIDEAHCVAEWGDSFRPAYLGLGELIKAIGPRVVTAFTATASPPILRRLAEVLFGGQPYKLVAGAPDRPNISYEIQPALSMRRALRQAVVSMPRPMIIFAASRPGVELLAEDLRTVHPGIDTRFYHAGLEADERSTIEKWFLASSDGVLCATCAYGMGMDKPDIRSVIHYEAPASVEAYLQEAGRAGRDGKPSRAVLLRKAMRSDYLPGTTARPQNDAPPGQGTPPGQGAPPGNAGQAASGGTSAQTGPAALAKSRAETMQSYASGQQGCRRSFLLKALGSPDAQETACSGCDVCDGRASTMGPGSRELVAALRRHPRRCTTRELAAFLAGKAGSPIAPCRGSLAGWSIDETEEAIESAVAAGLIGLRERWPWKARLVPGTTLLRGRTLNQVGRPLHRPFLVAAP